MNKLPSFQPAQRWRACAATVLALLLVGCAAPAPSVSTSAAVSPAAPKRSSAPAPRHEAVLPLAAAAAADPAAAPAMPAEPATVAPVLEGTGSLYSLSEPRASGITAENLIDKGRASWYGPRFHGRRTASGERFDMHALTAAHKTLPFGTRVRVRSAATGKEVVVRINDRGPYAHKRIIDLSLGAITALGLRSRGVTEVVLLKLE